MPACYILASCRIKTADCYPILLVIYAHLYKLERESVIWQRLTT